MVSLLVLRNYSKEDLDSLVLRNHWSVRLDPLTLVLPLRPVLLVRFRIPDTDRHYRFPEASAPFQVRLEPHRLLARRFPPIEAMAAPEGQ